MFRDMSRVRGIGCMFETRLILTRFVSGNAVLKLSIDDVAIVMNQYKCAAFI